MEKNNERIKDCERNLKTAKEMYGDSLKFFFRLLLLSIAFMGVAVFTGEIPVMIFIGFLFGTLLATNIVSLNIEYKDVSYYEHKLMFLENEEELNEALKRKTQSKNNGLKLNEEFEKSVIKNQEANLELINLDNYDLLTLNEMKKILEGEEAPVLENTKTLGQKTNDNGKNN